MDQDPILSVEEAVISTETQGHTAIGARAGGAGGAGAGQARHRLTCYSSFHDIPFEAANTLLLEHAALMHGRMVKGGGPDFDYHRHIASFWEKIDQVLAPNGRFYLAWAPDGRLVGTGSLRRVADDVGELKHLFVRPEARGTGLGRALVQQRMQDARDMGLRRILADTFAANWEMPALYDRLGFSRVQPFDLSGTASLSPELIRHMLFFSYDL